MVAKKPPFNENRRMNKSNNRLQTWFSGRVQGVGFRYKALKLAGGYDVCGYVENLDDGRVHLCAVGDESEVRAYTDELSRVMADFIKQKESRADISDAKYRGFEIR